MTSRELVKKTLGFESPPGIPRQKWILPWAEKTYPRQVRMIEDRFPDDIVSAPAVYTDPVSIRGERYEIGTYIDEWGCQFTNLHDGVIGIVQTPLISSWDQLDGFHPPDATTTVDKDAVNHFCRQTEQFVLSGSVVRPFERLMFIRTMEQAMIDLMEQPAGLTELLRRIHSHYCREVEVWAKTDVDGIALMDDWGVQNALMVSPDLFRRLFKPMYRDYVEIARQYNKSVFMHSDGYIIDIIPDFIEIGIDALNSQIYCMGVEELGSHFRGKITFWGEIDRQQLLPHGTEEDIRAAVETVHNCLYDGGGMIAQCEFGPGAKPQNIVTVFETWKKLDHKLRIKSI
jgi:uroporphyrinogen decarboxylase